MISSGWLISLLGVLSFLIYAIVELFAPLLWENDPQKAGLRKMILQVAASAIGVIIAIAFHLDLFTEIVGIFKPDLALSEFASIVGMVCTGLLIGRGSDWFHALRNMVGGISDQSGGDSGLSSLIQ